MKHIDQPGFQSFARSFLTASFNVLYLPAMKLELMFRHVQKWLDPKLGQHIFDLHHIFNSSPFLHPSSILPSNVSDIIERLALVDSRQRMSCYCLAHVLWYLFDCTHSCSSLLTDWKVVILVHSLCLDLMLSSLNPSDISSDGFSSTLTFSVSYSRLSPSGCNV
jgi:hypothetical protein